MSANLSGDRFANADMTERAVECYRTIEAPILTASVSMAIYRYDRALESGDPADIALRIGQLRLTLKEATEGALVEVPCPFAGHVEIEWTSRVTGIWHCPFCDFENELDIS